MKLKTIIQEEIYKALNELADSFRIGKRQINYDEFDAYPFGMRNGEEGDNEFDIGNMNSTHMESGLSQDYYHSGRVWNKLKIISFWEYPKDLHELKDIIKDINDTAKQKDLKIKVDDSWKIEFPAVNDISDVEYQVPSFFVPINNYDYKIAENPLAFKKAIDAEHERHIQSPLKKTRREVPAGLGSMKAHEPVWMSPEKLDETGDAITYNNTNLTYETPGTYAFVYFENNDKVFLSAESETHGNIYKRHIFEMGGQDGRVWSKQKVLSFWDYPKDKDTLLRIIDLLNEMFAGGTTGIKIDNSWQVEFDGHYIPVKDYKYEIVISPIGYKEYLEKQHALHIQSPLTKPSRTVPAGLGSKKKIGGMTPSQYQSMMGVAENRKQLLKKIIREEIKKYLKDNI